MTELVRQSRLNNARDGITGMLIFDGVRFAQYVEGPVAAISSLRDRLTADNRHTNMEVLEWSLEAEPRRFPNWRLGYLKFDLDAFGLEGLRGKKGVAAIEAFRFILPTLDITIETALP